MSKEEKTAKKLAKKETKQAKKQAKFDKASAKYQAKAAKKHQKDYDKFVKETEKKNAKLQQKAQKDGKEFVPIAIPAADVYQTKSEIKAAKAGKKAYASYVKKLEKKNAKAEKKSAKKGKPFVATPIPTEEEFLAGNANVHKTRNIILMIILLLLICFLIYFIIMYINYEYTPHLPEETTVTEDEEAVPADYPPYENPHEITTTPNYSIADAKLYLKQALNDNWGDIGLSHDPSGSAISYNNRMETINGAECYMFTCDGNTYAVSIKLSAAYLCKNGDYIPVGFNDTNIIFG
ncbi:MAG: hypothetical protein J1E81_06595 [Eubacterium sp.]|nr:hypothetical protein [Eubacterium sp.]